MPSYTIHPNPPPVPIRMFCDVVGVLTKHFGKKCVVTVEQMDTVRAVAGVLQSIGEEATRADDTR